MSGPPERRADWVGPGILLVLLTAVISGLSTFVNAYAVQGTNSDAFVTLRNLAVAGLLLPIALVAGQLKLKSLRRVDWLRLVVIGVVGGAVPFLLFFRGLELATAAGGAATASFGYRTLFLMATLLGVVALRERLQGPVLLAAALLLVGNGLLLSLGAPIWTDGSAYVLAATGLWAIEYTVSKRTLRDLPSTTVGLGRMGFGAGALAVYLSLTAQWSAVGGFTAAQWGWVGISAALLLGFVLSWYGGLKRVEVGRATSVLVLGFPITWALTIALKGAPLELPQALGAAAIALGALVAVGLASLRATGRFVVRAVARREAPPA